MPVESNVYLMHFRDSRFYKVGVSKHPEYRRVQIERSWGHPVDGRLAVWAQPSTVIASRRYHDATWLESRIHALLKDSAVVAPSGDGRTEIFELSDEDLAGLLILLGGPKVEPSEDDSRRGNPAYQQFSAHIPAEMYRKLKIRLAETGANLSDTVEQAIQAWLEK